MLGYDDDLAVKPCGGLWVKLGTLLAGGGLGALAVGLTVVVVGERDYLVSECTGRARQDGKRQETARDESGRIESGEAQSVLGNHCLQLK